VLAAEIEKTIKPEKSSEYMELLSNGSASRHHDAPIN